VTERYQGCRAGAVGVCLLLTACAGGQPPLDWQLNSKAAMGGAVTAYLSGDSALEARQFELARSEVARTGRADLVARIELIRCAARVASLQFGACDGFEKLRSHASPPERAYADFLAARLSAPDIDLLPAAQRAVAASSNPETASASLRAVEDPFSRLVAAAVLFEAGRANPSAITLAVDTASSQGWRRPLLAWLNVQAMRAEKAGATDEAERLRRRIGLLQGSD